MGEANGADPIAEQDNEWKFALSEDKTKVRIAIPLADNQGVYLIDMTIADFQALHSTMGMLLDHLRMKRVIAFSKGEPRTPISWLVGRPNAERVAKFTALQFDAGLSTDTLLVFDDLDALKIADAIEKTVFEGMPNAEKAKMIAQLAPKPKIILPTSRH